MKVKPKILITGANGFTGQHACDHFLRVGLDITAVTRNVNFNNQVQTEHCDLTDKEAVRKLIQKVKPQYLLHLAGQNHVGNSWINPVTSIEANVMSTLYLIEAIRHEHLSCRVLVVGSALQFDPHNLSSLTHPYSLSKTLQVLIAQSWKVLYNIDVIIAQPSNLIGPGLSNGVCSIFAKKIVDMEEKKAEQVLEVNNLNIQRDFIDVRDVVTAYETLIKEGKSGEIYRICTGKSHSLQEIINMFKSLTTVDFEIKSQKNNHIEQNLEIHPLELRELGWNPEIQLESSLNDILNFYRNITKNS
ncbi:NAD-dependent epimerase/dehydratase family protein (plasmid) [Priestia megaterium]|uniref:NAD-dependent epimerase/dehydratase family protein n=1 Tax=Priestia megaterium TaxID=1404 RepID=UPI001EDA8731|nr:NAD-dependent epimerase/dehydratase family protein [Priestia megaterium]UKJ83553.1 NAD-dependent epimerase/dehydratase family protein [Priestia megaterium]